MPIQILMPALSPTMTEGNLAKWHKAEGDAVESGDVIAEIETDKATMEVEAVEEGTMGKILVAEGTTGVLVNQPIALLLEEGEDAAALEGAVTAAPAPAPAAPVEAAPAEAAPAPAAAPIAAAPSGGRVFASPLAKRLATNGGIDIAAVTGSGPHGRVVKRDVESAIASGGTPAAPQTATATTPAPSPIMIDESGLPPYREEPHSTMRKVIARRLTESKQTVPHFYLTVDCELDNLLALRKDLNSRSDAYKISVNDFIIRAVAIALKKVPEANAMWTDEAMRYFEQADVSVAVAIPGGLITPVIRDAGSKGLVEISTEIKDMATRARDGKLMPEEYQGGCFTISNLGMFGIDNFSAIINPPQACILAVGAGKQQAVVKDGALAVATVMSCTLAVDHRVVDGAVGAQFMAAFKPLIEDPVSMLL
ncbi:MAG: pyruvate dehydrogenase complex dihydrolipoamide acetyltransferase [Rhodospirillales bacterium]|jgi:pyruvate dehydrogenase E2 component (dihydrolipoamide acetyltransferase)|nr:pyruvate dehydrogenase complex dihydrolipoamide acetyltransferase [Rhodospirillales bacterium]MBT4040639.1 pyruvate dehydrogenase complex dihydrolipoamide acetyltransferase [Rhodospirillales bacterium]MBT5350224.1 pyruvate dehydrogenase complex dihydrolipoamide acetyltransferase [Rhodospirillales bacterium]MBT5520831.1 pyruvate dehydrogenase complex dihydrolipoamide acetyltransferase [Rhodospirillales bacterium]MBT6110702.1 pyruvate dehydrogenase complex dihydrolipoamide acetyltransferase [R